MKKFKEFIQGTILSQEEWEEEVFGPKSSDTPKQVCDEDQEKEIQHFKDMEN
jgi:hypothetical protein